MVWSTSNRVNTLPKNWEQLRQRVGNRDNWQCQWRLNDGSKCLEPATDCDHENRHGGDSEENLRMLCRKHHGFKSSSEGGYAYWAKLKATKQRLARQKEKEPWELEQPSAPAGGRGYVPRR